MTQTVNHFYDNSPIGVCIVRRDRQRMDVLYANPALRQMLSLPEDYIGRPLEETWPSDEIATLARKLKTTTPPREFILPVQDDKQRWALLTVQEGQFDGENVFILWATDVSSSKEAETQLQQAVNEADASAAMKANFLATMSHEIRTPMQSVYGLLELIGEEKPDVRIKTMIDIAKNSANGLLEILNDILDFAKLDTANMELDTFEVPLRTLVRGINEAMAVKIRGQHVTLRDEISADVPFVVIGDPKRLRQILMNLTGNALKFTREGAVTIRVKQGGRALSPPAHGIVLRFEIADSGIGMSPEVCAKLFKPFTQADSSTSRKYGGTGLGLSICRKLVELMGGQIGVESVEGEGSVFWFEIPTEEVSTQSSAIDLPKLDGISVLSVEDHPQGAKEIFRSLDSMGARVESCSTYKEALELVQRRPFDVGVIDQGLPDGLGLDLIREIMAAQPFMGLVMYTVRDDIGLQYSLNTMGVTYLSKPASRRGLGDAVKDAARQIARTTSDVPSRLLIAEDTASVRDILQRQLEKLNVEADFVEHGAQALTALETGKYDILFTDLHMPELDGYQLVERIRKSEAEKQNLRQRGDAAPKRLPIIALTADVQMGQRQTYLRHGFDECLLKPVSLGQLRRLLIRWNLLEEKFEEENISPAVETPTGNGQAPAIDVVMVRQQMGAFDAGTVEMLNMFIGMTAPLIARLRAGVDQADYKIMQDTAHNLKGAARSACCNVLGDMASAMQDAAEARKQDLSGMVTDIEQEFVRVGQAIRALKAD